MVRCIVCGINVKHPKDCELRSFPTPKNPEVQKQWLRVCKKPLKFKPHNRVCSKHFDSSDYLRDFRNELLNLPTRTFLKPDAVPHLHLPDSNDDDGNKFITLGEDFSDPDDPTDNTAFMDSLQPSDIEIDVGPIFETVDIKPNIELDNLPPPPPSPPPKRKRTATPDVEVAEQEDPLATKRTRLSPLVGYGEDGDKEDDDNFSGDEFDEEEDGDKVRRAYQLLKSVFDKKDKYDIFGHRLAARLRALKSAKVCRHVLDILESVIDDAEAGKYNNV